MTKFRAFKWEEKEQLRGKWIVSKDTGNEYIIDSFAGDKDIGEFFVTGIASEDLLDEFTFLDGTPCGVEEEEKGKDALRLVVDIDGQLVMVYGVYSLGYITDEGEFFILNSARSRDTYKKWLADDMPINSTPVEWREKEYEINEDGELRSFSCDNSNTGSIYDFTLAWPITGCRDDNIQRYSNGTPMLFS